MSVAVEESNQANGWHILDKYEDAVMKLNDALGIKDTEEEEEEEACFRSMHDAPLDGTRIKVSDGANIYTAFWDIENKRWLGVDVDDIGDKCMFRLRGLEKWHFIGEKK